MRKQTALPKVSEPEPTTPDPLAPPRRRGRAWPRSVVEVALVLLAVALLAGAALGVGWLTRGLGPH